MTNITVYNHNGGQSAFYFVNIGHSFYVMSEDGKVNVGVNEAKRQKIEIPRQLRKVSMADVPKVVQVMIANRALNL